MPICIFGLLLIFEGVSGYSKLLNETGTDLQEESNTITRTIELGRPISDQLNGGGKKFFTIAVSSGQYLGLLVHKRGIKLRVTLFDPKGTQVVAMSNPTGGHGRIYVSEIATASGNYKLDITSIEPWAVPGSFKVSVNELRDAGPEDARRIAAERSFAAALKESEARSFKAAINEYGKALSYWQEIHDPHWEPLTQYALAQTYYSARNLTKANEHLGESLKIQVAPEDWRITAASLNDLGFNRALGGNNQEAISLLNRSLGMFEQHGDRRGQASSLNNLAVTYGRMGDLRTSLKFAERALPLREAENFESGVNNLRNTLGNIHDLLGDPHKALEHYTRALEGWQRLAQANQLEGSDRLAIAFNSVASAHEKLGNWDKASQYYDDALKVPTITKPIRAAILTNKGALYASLGDFDAALNGFSEAKLLLDSLVDQDPDLKASILFQIGQVSASTGKLNEAVQRFQEARAAKPNSPKLAYILTALGDAWSKQGNVQEAMKAYEEALQIQLRVEDRRGQAITRQKMGEAYALSSDPSSALKELEQALSLWRAVIDRRGEATTLNSIASLERDRGHLVEALKRSNQATGILESLRTNVSSHQLRTSYFANHENYYEENIDIHMMLFQRDQSFQHLAGALESSEKSRARSLIETLAETRIEIVEGIADDLRKLEGEILSKLRAKLEAQTTLLSGKHGEKEASAISKEIADLIKQQDEVIGRIRSSSPKYSDLTRVQLLTTNQIQRQLDPNTLLVEYALGEKRSYVWVVASDSIKGFELPARAEVEAAANRLVNALTSRSRSTENEDPQQRQMRIRKEEADYPEASAAMSKLVIDPIASQLNRKRLVVVADGALQYVPFSALLVPSSTGSIAGEASKQNRATVRSSQRATVPLISQHEIVTLPSASVLALQRRDIGSRKPAPLSIAILADPVFDADDERVTKARTSDAGNGSIARRPSAPSTDGPKSPIKDSSGPETLSAALRSIGVKNISWLPFSRAEAEAIMKVAPRNETFAALDFDANRSTAASPSLANYKILHIATHGVMDLEHPELSGVILSMVDNQGKPVDGYLRLHEIYNLNLPAELVVLSACQTGVGKQIRGEGLIALTRGFMYAGAKSVVASYWKVDDKATAELMAEFYRQIFVNKLKPAAALRQAQIKMWQSRRWQNPSYWAGFFLQGEWN